MITHGGSARRGIEPLIAVIILVGVTIVIVVAFVSWMFGFWNVHISSHGQAVEVLSDSYFDSKTSTLHLHIKTHIDPATILHFEVKNANITSVSVYEVIHGNVSVLGDSVKATVGSNFWVAISIDREIPPGTLVYFKIFSEEGYVYWGSVVSK